ncbi:hypothetical protein EHQ81_08235 [Leptospira selangorensis]|uniref:Uncharacterized protein n=1 Tax=Leptospira selangorensis TaxID=2484982 RepID=A0A5F2BY29_9LEPT|nr:hypothetical protein [Leptospira selangorensis]TGM16354.1 hypothetical protein EHQ81_08235 [Leptospira selangorensis]TGM17695.1 hypothetical protein EHQ82_11470 [Leptospira selangorensis]
MNILKKILFWLGDFLFLLIPLCIILAESGTCTQGDDSIYFLFTQASFVVSVFCLFLIWFGIPSGGLVGQALVTFPFLLCLYFYIAYIPVYFVYSTLQNQDLCAVVISDLTLYNSTTAVENAATSLFSRSYAILMLLPVLGSFLPVYKFWKSGSFTQKRKEIADSISRKVDEI